MLVRVRLSYVFPKPAGPPAKSQEVTQAVAEETKYDKLSNDINSTEEHLRLDITAKTKELANLQDTIQAKVGSRGPLGRFAGATTGGEAGAGGAPEELTKGGGRIAMGMSRQRVRRSSR